ncbi:MAG TPA: SigB/SigF/SigG family RNA polymerase sigma factor [Stackebrandtia sp.]|jgi:RNA polymerase sigma-B factor|uniref:SigB/SigF/SigG family RNA polymerase sigma factor n=1 Tax=Stackebrandtia sp. TaxID=2023065 RepID=UPI002D4FC6A2|nr:SigB/SigF/SigG family RNA polymerase sigma factor [Stackebrandtia sp.]HZE41507.1 SigB/SigF/SigG family RNA polymerase sigma factor [Stackebrandtia sp.]
MTASHPSTTTPSRGEAIDREVVPVLEELVELPRRDPHRRRLRNSVVESAMPLADRLARRFEHRGEPLEDLTQVARLGLINAVDNFKTGRGAGFTRFAVPSILGEIKRYFRDKGWMVRVPRRLQETRLAFNESCWHLPQRLGRTPTVEEHAAYLGLPVEQVRAGIDCVNAYEATSLQIPAHQDSSTQLAEALGDDDPAMASAEARMLLRPLIEELPERERRILVLRFVDDLRQTEIAQRVGLSQMHVSRLLRQILTRLRAGLDA